MSVFSMEIRAADVKIESKTQSKLGKAVPRKGVEFADLVPKFLDYIKYDEELAEETITKYEYSLKRLQADLSFITSPLDFRPEYVTEIKKIMKLRGVGPSGVNSIIFALRKLLVYCRDVLGLQVMDLKLIKGARELRREVEYLTEEELKAFFRVINHKTIRGLRMRTLAQTLVSTGMRISEALSLDKKDIDWERKESVIIGKGNKQRTVHFTDESLRWLKIYFSKRQDSHPAPFVIFGDSLKRLTRDGVPRSMKAYAKLARIEKKVTPHIFRRTYATILVNNGCPPQVLQKLMGHTDIKTTLRYYAGADKKTIKESLDKYLKLG